MPLSRIRYTLNEKVGDPKAWAYTWAVSDDVTISAQCDFCGQTEQRLTYEVTRRDERLWICQRCVGRYPVGGHLDGRRLDPPAARAQVHGLTARLKQQTCHDIIRALRAALDDPALEEALVYFERNLQLSPFRAAVVFSALPGMDPPVDTRIFEVQTRSIAHQDEFGALDEAGRSVVWTALSPLQRRRLSSLGHAPAAAGLRRARARDARPRPSELAGERIPGLNEPARAASAEETPSRTDT